MERQVVFYRLSRKVINDRDAIPEDPARYCTIRWLSGTTWA